MFFQHFATSRWGANFDRRACSLGLIYMPIINEPEWPLITPILIKQWSEDTKEYISTAPRIFDNAAQEYFIKYSSTAVELSIAGVGISFPYCLKGFMSLQELQAFLRITPTHNSEMGGTWIKYWRHRKLPETSQISCVALHPYACFHFKL